MATTIRQRTGTERAIAGGRQVELDFRADDLPWVPATLLVPGQDSVAVPAAVLIHGYSSRREHMSQSIGRTLLSHGVASLAIDLPLHGARRAPAERPSARNPMEVLRAWRVAVREARLAVNFLGARPEVDAERMGIVGYSLGSFLATLTAAADSRVRAVVVAAGGDLPPDLPLGALARTVVDPLQSVRRLHGRPLLVVHGRHDRTMRPEQAQRLFDAAAQPKELRWWDAGHQLPQPAIDDAAAWLADRLG